MSAPDEDRWERYRTARNAPPGPESKQRPMAPRRSPGREDHPVRGLIDAFDAWDLLTPLIAASGIGAIWAESMLAKVLLGAIGVGITVLWYIARDAHDEPRTTGELAPPRDDRSKRRR